MLLHGYAILSLSNHYHLAQPSLGPENHSCPLRLATVNRPRRKLHRSEQGRKDSIRAHRKETGR